MPDLDGMGVLARMRQRDIAVPAIVQTAHGSIEAVISAMRAGAIDFVVKPVGAERLQVSIKNALRVDALEDELRRATRRTAGELGFRDIVSRAESMARTVRLAERAAKSNIPVLIEGESGVGKELMARAIQGSSERRGKPFVTVNCGALPETLVEFDPVRPREGRLHRRDRKACRQIRRGQRRHAVPRRDRRTAARGAGQAPARAAGGRDRSGRRAPPGQGRRPPRLGDQPEPDRTRQGRPLPRGSVLSPQRLPDLDPAAARARLRHSRSRAALPRPLLRRGGQAHPRPLRRGARAALAPTTGRATSASSRTRCSAPWCWPTATN